MLMRWAEKVMDCGGFYEGFKNRFIDALSSLLFILLGVGRKDGVPSARLCGVTKGVNEGIDEGVLRWFDHVEGMESDRIAERV